MAKLFSSKMESLTDILSKTFESEVLIRFGDCDPFNHLNNSKYLEYFMNAREDHLQTGHGLNLVHIAKEKGVGWVVSKHQIAYMSPANLAEIVIIQTTMIEWRERGLLLEMRMWNTDKTKLKAIMWSEFVHFDLRSQKSIPHSKEMDKLFKQYENPLDEECLSFESRLKSVGRKTAQEL